MRFVAASLAIIAALIGATIGVAFAGLVTGRLDLFVSRRGEPFHFIWGVRSEAGWRGIALECLGALARAAGAFALAQLVLALFGSRPTAALAIVLVTVLLAWDLRNVLILKRAPITVPAEVNALQWIQVATRALAALLIAPFFVHL